MKFGEPSAEPEEHNEALPATSNTAQSPADLEQTMLGESFAVTIIYIYNEVLVTNTNAHSGFCFPTPLSTRRQFETW